MRIQGYQGIWKIKLLFGRNDFVPRLWNAKNIDRESKPLKGSIDFLNWAQKNNILL